jgi:hypothetical protein
MGEDKTNSSTVVATCTTGVRWRNARREIVGTFNHRKWRLKKADVFMGRK